ncbi:MAG: PmoA family protein [Bryobacteraceae bacterium]
MTRILLLALLTILPATAQVKLTQGTDRILIDIDGKPFSALFIGADTRKPYLHPLRAASGTVVTRAFPMDLVEGESRDHPHHRGLWFTHGDVNGYDFWANESGQKKGKVVLKKIHDLKSGKKAGSLTASFQWEIAEGKPLLEEVRTMTFHSDPALRIIDFDIKLTAIEQVKFGDTKEGVFAIRLVDRLNEKVGTGRMVASDGQSGEKAVWGKRFPWVDYSGELDGEKVGVAIFDHPSNPKHPTYWHSRAYGLFAANIFGEHDFIDKSHDGSITLDPGGSLQFRYRVIVHPGDADTVNLGEHYRKYASGKKR